MNKKMRELLAKIENKRELAKGYTEGENKDLEKAKEILNEIDKLQEEYEVEKRLFESEKESAKLNKEDVAKVEKNIAEKKEDKEEENAVQKFAKQIRNIAKGMNEGTPADGGYTVPEDISTMVEERREAKASLIDLVSVENVTTNKGSRTFKKRSQQTGFTKVGEGGKITKNSTNYGLKAGESAPGIQYLTTPICAIGGCLGGVGYWVGDSIADMFRKGQDVYINKGDIITVKLLNPIDIPVY